MQVFIASPQDLGPWRARLPALPAPEGRRRESFLNGRALILAAATLAGQEVDLLGIGRAEGGKPHFTAPGAPGFNLSDSGELLALAFGQGEMGVDLEAVRERRFLSRLARYALTPGELSHFSGLGDGAAQLRFFIRQWTVRECLVKVSGAGLRDLRRVEVDLGQGTAAAPGVAAGQVRCLGLCGGLPEACLSAYVPPGGT
nr:4'-phosphopantetheinyl transferase superfamily protein [Succinivibrionaceae bacterium]